MAVATAPTVIALPWGAAHPLTSLVMRRAAGGLATLLFVSIIVFAATDVLPGNAAYAIAGHSATPGLIHHLEMQLHLNRGPVERYWLWLSGVLTGRPGNSLVSGISAWQLIRPRLENSAMLMVIAGLLGSLLVVGLGALAALRRDRFFDHASSLVALAVTALPEFVVAVGLTMLLSTLLLHLLPGVSVLPLGELASNQPDVLVLPVATLVIVIVPYIYRMTRAAMIEALEAEYVQMARLKGAPAWRIVFVHALPNAIPAIIQVVGLNFLYLAGGIVIVESVFNFPGVGQGLVQAVTNRDVPVIQLLVLLLAAFYVFMNIATDVIALAATPRRRIVR